MKACLVLLLVFVLPAAAQTPTPAPATRPQRLSGKPNLNGIWQAVNTANWNLEAHSSQPGAVWQAGAIGAIPAGPSFVDVGEIPYLPAARAKKNENFAKRMTEDPEARCYLPGLPRATYMPYAFQIVQSGSDILMIYEYASANRLVNMGKPKKAGSDTWMGTNNGRWEGDALVVDVTGLNGLAWFDRSGNFASDKLHVIERFTPVDANHINYEATIEDPTVFSKPWKISMPLYRRLERNAQLYDFKCVEFAEDLIYGQYLKNPKK
jgi:hypothetical protein